MKINKLIIAVLMLSTVSGCGDDVDTDIENAKTAIQ